MWTHGSRPTDSCSKRTQQSSAGARTEDTRGDGTAPRRVFGKEFRNTPACPSGGRLLNTQLLLSPHLDVLYRLNGVFIRGTQHATTLPPSGQQGQLQRCPQRTSGTNTGFNFCLHKSQVFMNIHPSGVNLQNTGNLLELTTAQTSSLLLNYRMVQF